MTINEVTVWNRNDGCYGTSASDCGVRLAGATVKLFGAGDTLLATSSPLLGIGIQTVYFGVVTGVEWVQVIQESRSDFLHFAEIEVWGKLGVA